MSLSFPFSHTCDSKFHSERVEFLITLKEKRKVHMLWYHLSLFFRTEKNHFSLHLVRFFTNDTHMSPRLLSIFTQDAITNHFRLHTAHGYKKKWRRSEKQHLEIASNDVVRQFVQSVGFYVTLCRKRKLNENLTASNNHQYFFSIQVFTEMWCNSLWR